MDEKIAMLESEVVSLKSQVNMLSCELYALSEKQKDKTAPFEITLDGKFATGIKIRDQEPFIGGGLESFDEEKYEKEFRAGVVAVLNEALRPGGLLWKHLTR